MTEYNTIEWPLWFIRKYLDIVWFSFTHKGIFSSYIDTDLFREDMADFPKDIQKAIDWDKYGREQLLVVILHECGGVTRLHITRNSIRWSEPTGWEKVEEITHRDCLYCDQI